MKKRGFLPSLGINFMTQKKHNKKVKVLSLDAETVPTSDNEAIDVITREIIAKQKPLNSIIDDINSRYKKQKTIDVHIEEAERNYESNIEKKIQEAITKTSVDPAFARMICIAFCNDEFGTESFTSYDDEDDKVKFISSIVEYMNDVSDASTLITGFNFEGFDLALMLSNFRRYNVRPPSHFPVFVGRYWKGNIMDTMKAHPKSFGQKFVSAKKVMASYGIKGKDYDYGGSPMDGSRVYEAYLKGDYNDITAYCEQDAREELEIARKQLFGFEKINCSLIAWQEQVQKLYDSDLDSTDKNDFIVDTMIRNGIISE